MLKFQVQRSIQIDASLEKVYDTVVDYETWTTWSPWLCAEPDAKVTITGEPSSVGAVYAWDGEIVGAGELEHQNLEPNRLIEDEIRFTKPFKSKSKVFFEIEPVDGQTKITWHMQGSMPVFLFWMIPMMKTFIGMDCERGLKMLKEWIETGEILSQTTIRGIKTIGPLKIVGVRKTCTFDEIGLSMEGAFCEVTQNMTQLQLPLDGQAISVYHKMDPKAKIFEYTSGYTVPDSVGDIPSDLIAWSSKEIEFGTHAIFEEMAVRFPAVQNLSIWSIPQVQALATEHIGSYEHLGNAWSAANQYARFKKLKQSKHGTFEIYRNDPQKTPPAELRTEIFLPLK